MNSQQKLKTKGIALSLLLLSGALHSCKKSNEVNDKNGITTVVIHMLGTDETNEPLATTNGLTVSGLAVQSERAQTSIVSFDENTSVVATLVPKRMYAGNGMNSSLSTSSTSPELRTAAIIQNPLAPNVQYKVLVYDNTTDNLVAVKDYVYGHEGTTGAFTLDAGKPYTFIAYSINRTDSNVPTPSGTLSSATTGNVIGDLMYFKVSTTLTTGKNDLNIILKHQFSQITTNVSLDASVAGNITSIGSGIILPSRRNGASIKLSNGQLTYGNQTVVDVAIVYFNNIQVGGARSGSSTPTLVINPITAGGMLDISSLTIKNGTTSVTKQNLSFTNLQITPGVEYNFNLKIVSN